MKIKYKLMLAILGVIIILFFFNGYSMLHTTYSEMFNEKCLIFSELTDQVLRSFEMVSDNIEYSFFDFFRTEGVGNILSQVKTPGHKNAQLRMKLITLLSTQSGYLEDACIVDMKGEICFSAHCSESEKKAFRQAFAVLNPSRDVQWHANGEGRLYMCRTIYTLVPYVPQGYLLGRLNVDSLRSLTGMNATQDGMFVILDQEKELLFASRDVVEPLYWKIPFDMPEDKWISRQSEKDMIWSFHMTSNSNNWSICFNIPEQIIMASYYRIRQNLFVTYGLLIVLGTILALLFSKSITQNISYLMTSINRIHDSGIKEPISVEVKGNDEIAELAKKYNWLFKYINSIHQAEYDLLELKYRFIQAQINPHFISNILSSISSYSIMGNMEKMESLCIKVSKYLKNNLRVSEQRFISIKQEISNLREYVDIYCLIYPIDVNFVFTILPEADKMSILSMLLQPLVENSLLHATNYESGHHFVVGVNVSIKDDRVCVEVYDNGCGISPHVIRNIEKMKSEDNSINQDSNGFGITAVIRRLNLQYGRDYTFEIHCPLEGGTRIVILYPIEDEIRNCKGTDDPTAVK